MDDGNSSVLDRIWDDSPPDPSDVPEEMVEPASTRDRKPQGPTRTTDHKLLDREAEYALTKAIFEATDKAEKRRLIMELVAYNIRLVQKIARGYGNRPNFDFDEAVQEGCISLIHAAEKFNYKLGNRFATYATWWVRQAIRTYASEKCHVIRVPEYAGKEIAKVHAAVRKAVSGGLGRPTVPEIAERTGLSEKRVRTLQGFRQRTVSLDQPISRDPDSPTLLDTLAGSIPETTERDTDDKYKEWHEILKAAIINLPTREAQIFCLRTGFPHPDFPNAQVPLTLKEVAEIFNLSRERIRQLEAKARKMLMSDPNIINARQASLDQN